MEPNEYFRKFITIDAVYEPEDVCFPIFWNLKSEFTSLFRYWKLNRHFVENSIITLNCADLDQDLDDYMYDEEVAPFIRGVPDLIRNTTVSAALSLLEKLLAELHLDIKTEFHIDAPLSSKKMPYVNRYVKWMQEVVGIEFCIEKSTWRNLAAIREVRNRFHHLIDKEMDGCFQNSLDELCENENEFIGELTDKGVENALSVIADFIKSIEIGYIAYWGENTPNDDP